MRNKMSFESLSAGLMQIQGETLTHIAIRCTLENGIPVQQVCKELYEQSKDNRPLVAKLVGENLLTKIETLCGI